MTCPVPTAPLNVTTSLITNNSVVITWRQPVRPNGKQEDDGDDVDDDDHVNHDHVNDDHANEDHVNDDDKEGIKGDKSLTFLWQG